MMGNLSLSVNNSFEFSVSKDKTRNCPSIYQDEKAEMELKSSPTFLSLPPSPTKIFSECWILPASSPTMENQ